MTSTPSGAASLPPTARDAPRASRPRAAPSRGRRAPSSVDVVVDDADHAGVADGVGHVSLAEEARANLGVVRELDVEHLDRARLPFRCVATYTASTSRPDTSRAIEPPLAAQRSTPTRPPHDPVDVGRAVHQNEALPADEAGARSRARRSISRQGGRPAPQARRARRPGLPPPPPRRSRPAPYRRCPARRPRTGCPRRPCCRASRCSRRRSAGSWTSRRRRARCPRPRPRDRRPRGPHKEAGLHRRRSGSRGRPAPMRPTTPPPSSRRRRGWASRSADAARSRPRPGLGEPRLAAPPRACRRRGW